MAQLREFCQINVLGDFSLTRLSGLRGSKASSRPGDLCSFPKRGIPNFHIVKPLSKSKGAHGELILFFGLLETIFYSNYSFQGTFPYYIFSLPSPIFIYS